MFDSAGMRSKKFLFIVLLLILISGSLHAQITQTGILTGTVIDEADSPVPFVIISLEIDNIKKQRISTFTDENGQFRIPGLTPGVYKIDVELDGYRLSQAYSVKIRIGIIDEITLRMVQSSGVREQVEDGYEFGAHRKSDSSVYFPANMFALLPRMEMSDVGILAGGASVSGAAVSWLGSAVSANDLTYNSDQITNSFNGYFPVAEPQVSTDIEIDSYSKSSENLTKAGGVVTLIPSQTKSGFQGYFSSNLAGSSDADSINNIADDAESTSLDLSLGLSKSFFENDAAWLGVHLNWQESTINKQIQTLVPGELQNISAMLSSVIQVNETNRLSGRYLKRDFQDDYHFRPNLLIWRVLEGHIERATDDLSEKFDYLSIKQDILLTDIMSVSMNGHWLSSNSKMEPHSENRFITPIIDYKKQTVYQGSHIGTWEKVTADRLMAKATVDFYLDEMAGAHSISMGAVYETSNSVRNAGYDSFYRENVLRAFQYKVAADFYTDRNGMVTDIKNNVLLQGFRIFAEDNWTPHPRTSIKLGIHYNGPLVSNNKVQVIDWDSISPQLALSYDLFGDSKAILRFGAARYYHSALAEQVLPNLYGSGRLFNDTALLRNNYTLIGGFQPAWTSNYNILEHQGYDDSGWSQANLQTNAPYTNEVVLSLDLEPINNSVLTISYVNRRSKQLLSNSAVVINGDEISRDLSNLYSEDSTFDYDGDPYIYWVRTGSRGNFVNSYYWDNDDRLYRSYQGLIFRGSYNPSPSFYLTGSYTYAISRGNIDTLETESSGFAPEFSSPSGFHNSDGYLSTDRRHVAALAATVMLPYQSNLGLIGRYLSGAPYNRFLYNPSLYSLRYDIKADPRGSQYRYDDLIALDLRLEKSLKIKERNLSLFVDVYNLLNQRVVTLVDERDGETFGLALERQLPLSIRLGMKISF